MDKINTNIKGIWEMENADRGNKIYFRKQNKENK